MKQLIPFFFILLLLSAACVFLSCGGGDEPEPATTPTAPADTTDTDNPGGPGNPDSSLFLDVSPAALYFEADGGQQTIVVSTNAPGWVTETDAAWCSLQRDGSMLVASVPPNDEGALRTADIVIKTADGGLQRTVVATQSMASGGNFIKPASHIVGAPARGMAMETAVRVETNLTGWVCRSDQPWCRVRCDAAHVYLFVEAHSNLSERKAVVTLSHEETDYAQITVVQEPAVTLHVTFPDGRTLPASGGTIAVKVYTNISDWTAQPLADDCWFTVTKTDGETLTLAAPRRQGSTPRTPQEVQVTAGDAAYCFTISEGQSSGEGYDYGDDTSWDD